MTGRAWDVVAGPYDLLQRALDPRVLRGTRRWLAGRAIGRTLEVAIGSGLTLPHYRPEVRLAALDLSTRMLAVTGRRAGALGREVDLRRGDARRLPWPDASVDTVLCVFGLCVVPDQRQALTEMGRVLRPGGTLLLADHVVATRRWVRGLQAVLDATHLPLPGEHWRRRPLPDVLDLGFEIEAHERFLAGVVERLAARRPTDDPLTPPAAAGRGGAG
ncbi:MAG: class I SAM-dependent methyltransferase [Kineosporiaceae bacterium]